MNNFPTDLFDPYTQTSTTTSGQSGPGSNGNKWGIPYSTDL